MRIVSVHIGLVVKWSIAPAILLSILWSASALALEPCAAAPAVGPAESGRLRALALAKPSAVSPQDFSITPVDSDDSPDLFTGRYRSRIPLPVPGARNGLIPRLELVYDSWGRNSWLGVGWNVTLFAIVRGDDSGLDYAADNFEYLADVSHRLVPCAATAGEYRAEIEGQFLKFAKGTSPDGFVQWEVTGPDGTLYTFGDSPNTRLSDPTDALRTSAWFLSSIKDGWGNLARFNYTHRSNVAYLASVQYNGFSSPDGAALPANVAVSFDLEDRPDITKSLQWGYEQVLDKRLRRIRVTTAGNEDTSIELSYDADPALPGAQPSTVTGASLLTSVEQVSPVGGRRRISTFRYLKGSFAPASIQASAKFNDADGWAQRKFFGSIRLADINGDARADVCGRDSNGITCLLAADGGFATEVVGPPWSDAAGWGDDKSFSTIRFGDLNGDGRADICGRSRDGLRCALSEGTRFGVEFVGPEWSDAKGWSRADLYATIRLVDVTGDGAADVCARSPTGIVCAASTGAAFSSEFPGPAWEDAKGWNKPSSYLTIRWIDLNNDGKLDVCGRNAVGITCSMSATDKFGPEYAGPSWSDAAGWTTPATYSTIRFGDLNGDGRPDICARAAQGVTCAYGALNGFTSEFAGPTWGDAQSWNAEHQYSTFALADVDGNGQADFCGKDGSGVLCLLSSAFGAQKEVRLNDWSVANGWNDEKYFAGIMYGDVEGAGRDSVCARYKDGIRCSSLPQSAPELLTKLTNAYGGSVSLDYRLSSKIALNDRLPIAVWTVGSIATDDGRSQRAVTEFEFGGGFLHATDHKFRGFGVVSVNGPKVANESNYRIQRYWFHQGNDAQAIDAALGEAKRSLSMLGFQPLPHYASEKSGSGGYLQGRPYRVLETDVEGSYATDTLFSYYADSDGVAPFFVPEKVRFLQRCRRPACVAPSAILDSQAIASPNAPIEKEWLEKQYDDFGNVVSSKLMGNWPGIFSGTLVVTDFINDAGKRLVRRPAKRSIYSIREGGDRLESETRWDYGKAVTCGRTAGTATFDGAVSSVSQAITTASSSTRRFAYDSFGNNVCALDPEGAATTTAFDSTYTYPVATTNPLEQTRKQYLYGVNEPLGFGRYGQLARTVEVDGSTRSKKYDQFGEPLSSTRGGLSLAYRRTKVGAPQDQQELVTLSTGTSAAAKFDGFGRVYERTETATAREDVRRLLEYTAQGWITSVSPPVLGSQAATIPERYFYAPDGALLLRVSSYGSFEVSCLGAWESLTINERGGGQRTRHDAFGNTVSLAILEPTSTSPALALPRPLTNASVNRFVLQVCNSYDASIYSNTTYERGALGAIERVVDHTGVETTLAYDLRGQLTRVVEPNAGETRYVRSLAGYLLEQHGSNGSVFWSYDVLGRRTQLDIGARKPVGSGDFVFCYDGDVCNAANPPTVSFSRGRLSGIRSAAGVDLLSYDELGAVSMATRDVGGKRLQLKWSYLPDGRIESITYPDGERVSYVYNGQFLGAVRASLGGTLLDASNWAADGTLLAFQLGNGAKVTRKVAAGTTRDCRGPLFARCFDKLEGLTKQGQNWVWTGVTDYDISGNISRTESNEAGITTFGYDFLDRVIEAKGPVNRTYIWDRRSNLRDHSSLGNIAYTTFKEGRYLVDAPSKKRNEVISHSRGGDLVAMGHRTYSYNHLRQLTTISDGRGDTSLTYDWQGDLGEVRSAEKQIVFFGKFFSCVNGDCTKHVFAEGHPIASRMSGAETNYYHSDQQGTVFATSNSAGALTTQQLCSPFGSCRTSFGRTREDLRRGFLSQIAVDANLYIIGARPYDGEMGRFLTPDAVFQPGAKSGATSPYTYALANPLRYSDSSGLSEDLNFPEFSYHSETFGDIGGSSSRAERNGGGERHRESSEPRSFEYHSEYFGTLGEGKSTSAHESSPYELGLGDIWNVAKNYLEINEIANKVGMQYQGHNDTSDAQRHAEASRQVTEKFGERTARAAGILNETTDFMSSGDADQEEAMDLYNNEVGIRSAKEGRDVDTNELIELDNVRVDTDRDRIHSPNSQQDVDLRPRLP